MGTGLPRNSAQTEECSRGAALECSPGRKPGSRVSCWIPSPEGAKESLESFAPSGLSRLAAQNPGLAPGATLSRRSAAGIYE